VYDARMRDLPIIVTALAAILFLCPPLAAGAAEEPARASFEAMGGIPVNVSAWGLAPADFDSAVAAIKARVEELESIISDYRPQSEVSRLNRGEQLDSTPPELSTLAFIARYISGHTAGTFDITVKPLVELWRKCRAEQRLPTDAEYAAALATVGSTHYEVALDGSINFDIPGVELDFGGIAKGYFADEAVALLKAAGARRCLVDVGGDITTWQPTDGEFTPFRIGIRDPFGGDELYGVLNLDSGAVVTSGNYERYYEIDGHRYCHIFDPRTGRPVEGMLSVTVCAPRGIDADAYATAIFVMGLEVGSRFVERQDDLEAVIIAGSGPADVVEYVSPGLRDRVQLNPER
jgi:thiamine biosynthesis lipoprotein